MSDIDSFSTGLFYNGKKKVEQGIKTTDSIVTIIFLLIIKNN